MPLRLLFILIGSWILAVSGASAQPLTAGQIDAIRAASGQRCEEFFRSQAGKPLVKGAIKADWNGRGDYTRDYGQSIVLFAMRALQLDEQVAEANAALREFCAYHLARPQTLLEVHSFPSVCDALLRLGKFYGPRGSKAAGRLSAETYGTLLETMWAWARVKSKVADAEVANSQTWWLEYSENHHAQHFSTCWAFSMLLKDEAAYRDRPYEDGRTAREHYRAWTEYLREYLRQRAAKGALIEIDSPSYAAATLKGIYSLHDLSDDEGLRRRAGQFLDLYWALWAEQQIDAVHGGAKTRTYADSAQRGTDFVRRAAWYALGIGDPKFVHASMLPFVTTTWRMSDVVIALALEPRGPAPYEVRQRRMGLALEGFSRPPHYRLRTDFGGILRTSHVTPDFIVSALQLEARPEQDWAAISAQNRWMGAIFRGHADARIYPQGVSLAGESLSNQHWGVQARGTLIAQQLRTSRNVDEWRVFFARAGLSAPVREGEWFFAEAAGAFAAVRVVEGGAAFLPDEASRFGRWLKCADAFSPVILEVASRTDGMSFADFRRAVQALPVRVEQPVLTYTSLAGDRFTFDLSQASRPRVNGQPIDLAPEKVFDSPHVQSVWNSGVVTVRHGARELVLDFNR